ncbi:MAG TPA: hypothetical protein VHV83_02470 [Armatimonadota bacterium]|nr:hypothetical protein [Armatimonadota bacterium]
MKISTRSLLEVATVVAALSVLALILFPVVSQSQIPDQQSLCTANQKRIAQSLLMYAQEHNGTLPESKNVWASVKLPAQTLRCPTNATTGNGYVYSCFAAGTKLASIPDPATELLTADGQHAVTQAGSYANIAYSEADFARRHNGNIVESFADGHVIARPESSWKFHAYLWYDAFRLAKSFDDGQAADTVIDSTGLGHTATLAKGFIPAPAIDKQGINGHAGMKFAKSILTFKAPAHVYAAIMAGVRADKGEWPNMLCIYNAPNKLYGYITRFDDHGHVQSIIGVKDGKEMYITTEQSTANGQPFVYGFSINNADNTLSSQPKDGLVNGTVFSYLNGKQDQTRPVVPGEAVATLGYDGFQSAIIGAGGTADTQWGYFPGQLGDVILFDHPVDNAIIVEALRTLQKKYGIQ